MRLHTVQKNTMKKVLLDYLAEIHTSCLPFIPFHTSITVKPALRSNTNNFKIFGCEKTKGPKQNNHNRPMSPMLERGVS
jgi:hypothetical protein